MLFWYFGAPELLPEGQAMALRGPCIEAYSAIVALSLYTAAFMAEDMRSGIRSIPERAVRGRPRAGLRLASATMRRVVLPQALRVTVPPLISQTLSLWKNTSIATVIGVAELMYQAGGRRARPSAACRVLRLRERGLPHGLARHHGARDSGTTTASR